MATKVAGTPAQLGPSIGTSIRLQVSVSGAAGSTETIQGEDSDRCSKDAKVVRFTVNGQEVDMLVRTQIANGSLFVDLVASQSIAELVTTVNAMDLSSLGLGHPTPAKDFVDKQALVAAGGS